MEMAIILFFVSLAILLLEEFLGGILLYRPIVVGPIIGAVMGDLNTGLIIGSTLELAFVGNTPIGASNPPDITSGTILATAFAISTGQGLEAAVALGVPIAALVLFIKNINYSFIFTTFSSIADKYAEQGNSDKVVQMHLIGGILGRIFISLVVGISYYLGSPIVEKFLNSIPKFVLNGINIATGILPALGFAVLACLIINRKNIVFCLLGFVLAIYLKLPILAIAIIGTIIAIIINQVMDNQVVTPSNNSSKDDDF